MLNPRFSSQPSFLREMGLPSARARPSAGGRLESGRGPCASRPLCKVSPFIILGSAIWDSGQPERRAADPESRGPRLCFARALVLEPSCQPPRAENAWHRNASQLLR
jgi:hypothetical protein